MLEVELKLTAGPTLEAVLHNRSGVPINVLDAEEIQPTRLMLINAAGKELTPFDERTRRKFDRTVYKSSFETLAPGEHLELGSETFEKISPRLYTLRWGPFHFRRIPAGLWKARVVFESRIDRAIDDDSGRSVPVGKVWKGVVQSNTVEVRLD
ncbi:MAG: hypothetical protein AAB225_15810 [Acidobacteriota bacterium]